MQTVESKIESLIEEANRPVKSGLGRSSTMGVTTPARKKLADGIKYARGIGDAYSKNYNNKKEERTLNRNIAKAMSQTGNGNYSDYQKTLKNTKEAKNYQGRSTFEKHASKNPGAVSSYIPGVH